MKMWCTTLRFLVQVCGLITHIWLCTSGIHGRKIDAPSMIVREKMGVVFQKVTTLDNSVSFWSHTLSIDIPTFPEMKTQKPLCDREVPPYQEPVMETLCNTYGSIFHAYEEIRERLSKEVEEKIEIMEQLIPTGNMANVKNSQNGRVARAPLEFIGTISRNLFATATLSDIRLLQDHIAALENNPERFKGFQKYGSGLSSLQMEVNKNLNVVMDGVKENKALLNESFHNIYNMGQTMKDIMIRVKTRFDVTSEVVSIMHGINAREVQTMFLVLSELDKLIDSYTVLQKGFLPLHLITPQRIKNILENVNKHLKADFPTYRILHESPSIYYLTPDLVSYTRTASCLYVKFNIALSSSDLLYDVYALKHIPTTSGLFPNVSFTQIRDLPAYLGVTQDNKFFVELDQTTYNACPGNDFKTCSHFLTVFRNTQPTCSSALFMNNIDTIHELCRVTVFPNPPKHKTYFLDLDDDRVLVSTLDLNWIKSCHHKPSESITGCSQCVLVKSCFCSLSSKSFFLTTSIRRCLTIDNTDTVVLPNYLTSVSYLKTIEPNITFTTDKALKRLDDLSFQLPFINLSQSKWSQDAEKLNTAERQIDLSQTLKALTNNETLHLNPFDAWFDNFSPLPTIKTIGITDYLVYLSTPVIVIQVIVIARLYRQQNHIELMINRIFSHRFPELLTLSAVLDRSDAHPTTLDTLETSFQPLDYLFWILSLLATIYTIKQICQTLFRLYHFHNPVPKTLLLPRKCWLHLNLISGTKKLSITVCQLPLPLEDILY